MARKNLIRLNYLKLFTGYGWPVLVKKCDLGIENTHGLGHSFSLHRPSIGKYLICVLTSPLQLFAWQRGT